MDLIRDLNEYKCVNHQIDEKIIASAIFDIYNPCSFCSKRKVKKKDSIAFYNKNLENWDFPYIIETNCQNFARTKTEEGFIIYEDAKDIKNKIQFFILKSSSFGYNFNKNFFETNVDNLNGITFNGDSILPGKVIYPNGMSSSEFHQDYSSRREELALLIEMVRASHYKFYKDFHFRASAIETFAIKTHQNIELLEQQLNILTDYIHHNRNRPLSNVQLMKYIIKTAAGGSVWDSLKFIVEKLLVICVS